MATATALASQKLLSVVEGVPLDKLAELADKALKRTPSAISAVSTTTAPEPAIEPTVLAAIGELLQQIQHLDQGSRSRIRTQNLIRNSVGGVDPVAPQGKPMRSIAIITLALEKKLKIALNHVLGLGSTRKFL